VRLGSAGEAGVLGVSDGEQRGDEPSSTSHPLAVETRRSLDMTILR
jgi:hypothetical protein